MRYESRVFENITFIFHCADTLSEFSRIGRDGRRAILVHSDLPSSRQKLCDILVVNWCSCLPDLGRFYDAQQPIHCLPYVPAVRWCLWRYPCGHRSSNTYRPILSSSEGKSIHCSSLVISVWYYCWSHVLWIHLRRYNMAGRVLVDNRLARWGYRCGIYNIGGDWVRPQRHESQRSISRIVRKKSNCHVLLWKSGCATDELLRNCKYLQTRR